MVRPSTRMISSVYPISGGKCIIDSLNLNHIASSGRKQKPLKYVSVHNLVCTKKFDLLHGIYDMICVVSPSVQECQRYDRALSSRMHVLCTAVAENNFLSKYYYY